MTHLTLLMVFVLAPIGFAQANVVNRPVSPDLAAQAAQLALLAKQTQSEIATMKKFEVNVKAIRSAAAAESLARQMRSEAETMHSLPAPR